MKPVVLMNIMLLLAALTAAGCSSAPETARDPYNDADSQRSRADKAQNELDRDTSK